MEEAIVLYPNPAIGHLMSMVELGKLILTHQPSLSIHILIVEVPFDAASTASYIKNISATVPSVKFHHLPNITLPSTGIFEIAKLNNPNLHHVILSISKTYTVKTLILDFFCAPASSVVEELNIPARFYFTSGACGLALVLYLPTLHKNYTKSFKDLDTFVDIPGLPPILSSNMPSLTLDRNNKAYESLQECSNSMSKSSGIIINTFEYLEGRGIKALKDGLCVPQRPTPPLYCIGPLIAANQGGGSNSSGREIPECLTWLDSQPKQSVVFLCFGSRGLFSKDQLHEIAIGLERSGQRFLWVVRNPPSQGQTLPIKDQGDPDLTSLLPPDFLDRTKDRGLVVKSWAPQVLVLNHESVGGFVTHCGWNSTLEAVCAGVPMAAWPLYAEQKLNKVLMVEEMKIALSIVESENGFVTAEEVGKRVRQLMELEEGKLVRERIIEMKHAAEVAHDDGSPSRVALSELLQSWK